MKETQPIDLIISYKVTDDENGIEESENFSHPFSKFPSYQEVLDAFCISTRWALEENRDGVSFYFYASTINNVSLECDHEW